MSRVNFETVSLKGTRDMEWLIAGACIVGVGIFLFVIALAVFGLLAGRL